MTKRILVLSGSPKENSFSNRLAEVYTDAAKHNHDVRIHRIADMAFDPDLDTGYGRDKHLEPDLAAFQESVRWSDHMLITTPVWWGAVPAKLKGVFDRTFLPGFAFKYQKGKLMPDKLLTGKTARIVMTMDTPPWYYRLSQGAPALKQLKIATLEFCGFSRVRNNMLGPVISSNETRRAQWLEMLARLGTKGQ